MGTRSGIDIAASYTDSHRVSREPEKRRRGEEERYPYLSIRLFITSFVLFSHVYTHGIMKLLSAHLQSRYCKREESERGQILLEILSLSSPLHSRFLHLRGILHLATIHLIATCQFRKLHHRIAPYAQRRLRSFAQNVEMSTSALLGVKRS